MGKGRVLALLLLSLLLTLGLVGTAGAAPAGASYMAQLSGAEEVPARTTPASGMAMFEVSADGSAIRYSVTVTNITNLVMGHIHIAAKGENGAVVVPLMPPAPAGGGPKSGTIAEGTITAASLTGSLAGKPLADLIAAMDSGNTYANFHTDNGTAPTNEGPGDFPGGEIRGQIVRTGMPGLPNTGGGGARFVAPPPWFALAAVLTLGLAGATGARRRRA